MAGHGGSLRAARAGYADGVSSSETPFALQVEQRGDALVISLAGELDIATAPRLRDALGEAIRAGRQHVVVDLGEVVFVDSMGLAALLNGLRRLTRADARLSVVARHTDVLRTFRLTRLDTTFSLYETVDAALSPGG